MKSLLAVVTLALVTLMLEEKARQVAGDAQTVYGEAKDGARDATQSLSKNIRQRPLIALLLAGAIGHTVAAIVPRR